MKFLLDGLSRMSAEGRPHEIHGNSCAHCPSVAMPDDPETEEILRHATRSEQIDSVFRCAWRRKKACRGYCDRLGITVEDLTGGRP